jgi:hypothetical protein
VRAFSQLRARSHLACSLSCVLALILRVRSHLACSLALALVFTLRYWIYLYVIYFYWFSPNKLFLFHLDIVSGNMKAVMRLILALAAHFKPSSVRSATPEPARSGRRVRRSESSLSAVAAEAAATLHDVSRAAASAGTPYKGSRLRYSSGFMYVDSLLERQALLPT